MLNFDELRSAASFSGPVTGLTHGIYKYPARFSGVFVKKVIEECTNPGDLVADPFMGGATSLVEARARGRFAFGSDVSELAIFIGKVKTRGLTRPEADDVTTWCSRMSCSIRNGRSLPIPDDQPFIEPNTFRNLKCHSTQAIVGAIAFALDHVPELAGRVRQDFARCVLLRAAQIAINGNQHFVQIGQFSDLVTRTMRNMVTGAVEYRKLVSGVERELTGSWRRRVKMVKSPASEIHNHMRAGDWRPKLVITSPPYPGVNVLYHRWQLNGGKETALPFWITGTNDGKGNAFYQMNARANDRLGRYFQGIRSSFRSVRKVISDDGLLVQTIGFSDTKTQLPRYLRSMNEAGFEEVADTSFSGRRRRIIRNVPNRNWHAQLKGNIQSSREYVLIHRPV